VVLDRDPGRRPERLELAHRDVRQLYEIFVSDFVLTLHGRHEALPFLEERRDGRPFGDQFAPYLKPLQLGHDGSPISTSPFLHVTHLDGQELSRAPDSAVREPRCGRGDGEQGTQGGA
jgi:hypothetical protein